MTDIEKNIALYEKHLEDLGVFDEFVENVIINWGSYEIYLGVFQEHWTFKDFVKYGFIFSDAKKKKGRMIESQAFTFWYNISLSNPLQTPVSNDK